MSKHDDEYRTLLAKVASRDRDAIEAHWELGVLFGKYGEPVTDIAQAIGRSVTYVSDHIRIAQAIPTTEYLASVLENRDDIQTWTVLVDWVKSGGPGEGEPGGDDAGRAYRNKKTKREAGGLQLQVPVRIIKELADAGSNAREVMDNFWANVSVNLIISVAYPDRASQLMARAAAGEQVTLDELTGV